MDIGRCPPHTLTVFLASQSVCFSDSSTLAGNSDQPAIAVNLRTELIKATDEGGSRLNAASLVAQLGEFHRISESVIIDGGQTNAKKSVLFSVSLRLNDIYIFIIWGLLTFLSSPGAEFLQSNR